MRDLQVSQTLADRFWQNVDHRTGDSCWVWSGTTNSKGYGVLYAGRRGGRGYMTRAHRISWYLHHGEFPSLFVLHKCDNPPCVNPAHLFLGTAAENTADMLAKGRGRHPNPCHGEQHREARFTVQDVIDIRRRRSQGERTKDLAAGYGVHRQAITNLTTGITWKSVPM